MVGQNGHRIPLAGLPIHGSRHAFGETSEARDPGINRFDCIAKQHDIDYSRARHLQDKWKADDKMICAIQALSGKKTWIEAIVKKIMLAKRKLKLQPNMFIGA